MGQYASLKEANYFHSLPVDPEILAEGKQEEERQEKASYMSETLSCQLDNSDDLNKRLGAVMEEIANKEVLNENRRIDVLDELKSIADSLVERCEI